MFFVNVLHETRERQLHEIQMIGYPSNYISMLFSEQFNHISQYWE